MSTEEVIELHRAEAFKLNGLYNQQWRLMSIAQTTVEVGATTETVYVLEKR